MGFDKYKDEFDVWADMWAEMESTGRHPPSGHKAEIATWDTKGSNPNDVYHSYVDDMAQRERDGYDDSEPYGQHVQREEDPALIQEQRRKRAAKLNESKGQKKQNRTPNPIHSDTFGPDSESPAAVWVNENLLKEISALKDRLFKLENKLAEMGSGKKMEQRAEVSRSPSSISERIEKLRREIDSNSSRLGLDEDDSPWVVKRG